MEKLLVHHEENSKVFLLILTEANIRLGQETTATKEEQHGEKKSKLPS